MRWGAGERRTVEKDNDIDTGNKGKALATKEGGGKRNEDEKIVICSIIV